MRDWFDDESLWQAIEPFLFSLIRTEEGTPLEVERVLQLSRPPPGAEVLDMPCGRGRHALELARRGFRVTAVDRTARYLSAAAAAAEETGVELELVEEDMRRFRRPQGFDLALNLFTSFGYFEDPDDDLQVLRNYRDSLRPGGVLVLEMTGKEPLSRDFRGRDWHRLEDEAGEAYLLEDRSIEDDWTRAETRWILVRGGESRSFAFSLRLYSGSELRAALETAGFREVRLYGGLDGTPYDPEAERLVAVAEA